MITITKPGVYAGISDEDYHGDPVVGGSLSSSGARWLLKAPAKYRERIANRRTTKAFDLGKAVHAKVLGVGALVVTSPPEDWEAPSHLQLADGRLGVTCPPALLASNGAMSTGPAKAWKAAEELAGLVVLSVTEMWRADAESRGYAVVSPGDLWMVDQMAEAVLRNPTARSLVEKPGIAEASVFAPDPITGEWMRARPDFLPDRTDEETVMVDLKTADDADPDRFARVAGGYGYYIQDPWYRTTLSHARGDVSRMVFVTVEKEPPWLVSFTELQQPSIDAGMRKVREALDLWHACREADEWPGYPQRIVPIDIPSYLIDDDEIEVPA